MTSSCFMSDMNGQLRKNALHKCIHVSLINATWMQKDECENLGKQWFTQIYLACVECDNC